MKRNHLARIPLFVITTVSLSSCNIFSLLSSNQDYSYPHYSDASFSSETRGGYSNAQAKFTMSDVGKSAGFSYLKSIGNPKILVIPVSIEGYERNASSTNLARIKKAFKGTDNIWQSVESFYNISSFGRLNLDITIADEWYQSGKTPAEIYGGDASSSSKTAGVQNVLNSAVSWYKTKYDTDCEEFDSDNDGYIDAVWLIYSCPDYQTDTSLKKYDPTCWAYTYWADNNSNINSPSACTYGWASYDFMNEGYGSFQSDAHTFIHETGHMMGLEDYYDYNVVSKDDGSSPMGFVDMMDANVIDHNVFSKWSLGWVAPFVVTGKGSIRLAPSATTGECLIIPTSSGWNGSPFDEYIMLEYYTPENLNYKDSKSEYLGNGVQGFTQKGVRIYHVDSRLAKLSGRSNWSYTSSLSTNCILAHSNTPSYGDDEDRETRNYLSPNYRLIQMMDASAKRDFSSVYVQADDTSLFGTRTNSVFSFSSFKNSFPNKTKMNNGGTFEYKISVSEMTSDGVLITIS